MLHKINFHQMKRSHKCFSTFCCPSINFIILFAHQNKLKLGNYYKQGSVYLSRNISIQIHNSETESRIILQTDE